VLAADGRSAAAGQKTVVHQVEPATLSLHQLQVMKDAGEAVVAAAARVQDVRRRDAVTGESGPIMSAPPDLGSRFYRPLRWPYRRYSLTGR